MLPEKDKQCTQISRPLCLVTPSLTPVDRLPQPVVTEDQGWLCVLGLEIVLHVTVL